MGVFSRYLIVGLVPRRDNIFIACKMATCCLAGTWCQIAIELKWQHEFKWPFDAKWPLRRFKSPLSVFDRVFNRNRSHFKLQIVYSYISLNVLVDGISLER